MSWWTGQPAVKFHGLMNQGSTCYLNSVLQVLFMTREFREAVIRFATENSDREFIDGDLKDLFGDLLERETYTFKITRTLGITRVHEQQDAAEYFEKILRMTSPDAAEIFHGQMAHRTTCSVCETEDDRDGPFWHLPLELVDSSSGNYSVEEGIKRFFTASDFRGDNQMYCDHCDTKVDATSRYVIKHHPDVLILLLKRFDFSYKFMSYYKINRSVDVPHTLKIPEKQTYELYAVVDHSGDLRSGHYSATIKPQDEDSWYSFDDRRVSRSEHNPFPNSETTSSTRAYLLFYRRKVDAAEMSEERKEGDTKEKGSKTRKRPLDTGTDDGDSGSRKKKPFPVDGGTSAEPAADDEQDEFSDLRDQRIKLDKTTGISGPTEEEEEQETEKSDIHAEDVTEKDENTDDQEETRSLLSAQDQNEVKGPENKKATEKLGANNNLDFGSENKKTEERTDSSGCLLEEMREKDDKTDEQEDLKNIMDLTNKEPTELSDTQRTEKDTGGDEEKQTEEEEGETENSDSQSQKETVKDEEAKEQEEEEGEKVSDGDQNEVKDPENKEATESEKLGPNNNLDFKPGDSQRSAEPAADEGQDEKSFSQQEVTDKKTEGKIKKPTSEDETEEENRPLDSSGEKTEEKNPEKAELTETKEKKHEDGQRSAEPAADGHGEMIVTQTLPTDETTDENKQSKDQGTQETEKSNYNNNNNLDFKPGETERSAEPAVDEGQDEKNNIQVICVDVTGSENKETEERTDSSGRLLEEMREKDENTEEQDHLNKVLDLGTKEPTELSDRQRTEKDTTGDEEKQTEEEEEGETENSDSQSQNETVKDEEADDQEEEGEKLSDEDQNEVHPEKVPDEQDERSFSQQVAGKKTEREIIKNTSEDETEDQEEKRVPASSGEKTEEKNPEKDELTETKEKKHEDGQRSAEPAADEGQDEKSFSQQEVTDKKTEGKIKKPTSEDETEEENRPLDSSGEKTEEKNPEKAELTETKEKKHEDGQRSAEPAADGHGEMIITQTLPTDETTDENKQPEDQGTQETEKSNIHVEDVTERDENTDDQEEEGEKLPDEDEPVVDPEKAELTETKEKKHDVSHQSADSSVSQLEHSLFLDTEKTVRSDEDGDGDLKPADADKEKMNTNIDEAEEASCREESLQEKPQKHETFSERSNGNSLREEEEENTDRDEDRDSDKNKPDDQNTESRKAVKSEPHRDDGPLEEGRSDTEQTVRGQHETHEDPDDSHQQSALETRRQSGNERAEREEEKKKETPQEKTSRDSQRAAEREQGPKQTRLQIKIIEVEITSYS